ncbi:MAG: hypothetical protein K2O54_04600, partial [Prevotella sp.]|nr:hypothetical protein [Prevotella sp.]
MSDKTTLSVDERILGLLYRISLLLARDDSEKDEEDEEETKKEKNDESSTSETNTGDVSDEDEEEEEEDLGPDTTNIDELKAMWSTGKGKLSKKLRRLAKRIPGLGLITGAVRGIGSAIHFGRVAIGAAKEYSAIKKWRKGEETTDAVLSSTPTEEKKKPGEYSAEVNTDRKPNTDGILMTAAMVSSQGGIDTTDANETEAILNEGTKSNPDANRMSSKLKGLLRRNKDKNEESSKKSNSIWDTIKGLLGGIGSGITGIFSSLPGIAAAATGLMLLFSNPDGLGTVISNIGSVLTNIDSGLGGFLGTVFNKDSTMGDSVTSGS